MNEIELFQLGIREYKRARKISKLNEELMQHLHGSIRHVLRTADRHNIHLENREKLTGLTEKSIKFLDEIEAEASKSELGIFDDSDPTFFDSEKIRRRLDRTQKKR